VNLLAAAANFPPAQGREVPTIASTRPLKRSVKDNVPVHLQTADVLFHTLPLTLYLAR
jgi:hypothetical protein